MDGQLLAEVEAAAFLMKCKIIVFFEGIREYISQSYAPDASNQVQIELLLSNNHYRVLRRDRHIPVYHDHTYINTYFKGKRSVKKQSNIASTTNQKPVAQTETLNHEHISEQKHSKRARYEESIAQNNCTNLNAEVLDQSNDANIENDAPTVTQTESLNHDHRAAQKVSKKHKIRRNRCAKSLQTVWCQI